MEKERKIVAFKEAQAVICIILLAIIIDAVKSGASFPHEKYDGQVWENDYDDDGIHHCDDERDMIWYTYSVKEIFIYNKQYFCGFDTCRVDDDGDCLSDSIRLKWVCV